MLAGQVEQSTTTSRTYARAPLGTKLLVISGATAVPASILAYSLLTGYTPGTHTETPTQNIPVNTATPAATNTPAENPIGAFLDGLIPNDATTATPGVVKSSTPTAVNTALPASPTATETTVPAATKTQIPNTPTNVAPTESATPVETATLTPDAQTIQYLEGLGIDVMMPRSDWPVNSEEVVKVLDAGTGNSIDAQHLVRIMDLDTKTNKLVWHGWWMGEPAFPLQNGIVYDSNLHVHIDTKTNQPIFDPTKIFKSYDQLTDVEKANFNQNLVDVKINQDGIAVFARKGGSIRDGQPESEKNTQSFFGTKGSEVDGVEQISLIPVEQDLCVTDVELSGATRSFRQAVVEFRDNPQVQNGKLTVRWFNPETSKFENLDGRMLIKLAEQHIDISVLEKMPANTPLSPEDMAKRYGGQAEKWVVNPQTWEWFYESYELQPGVHYVNGVGAVDASGKLLVGAEQANSASSKMFDFNRLDTDALVQDVEGTGSFQATLFARQGTMGDASTKNHSWYTWGEGKITLATPGIEQMTFMPHNPNWCSPNDMPNELAARAKTLATEQPDAAITALYWDGSQFVTIVK